MQESMRDEGFVATSPKLRGAQIDVAASRVDWMPASFAEGSPGSKFYVPASQSVSGIRGELASGINAALGSGGAAKPARFWVTVRETNDTPVLLFAPCLVLLTILGCPAATGSATVDLKLEVDGQVYEATGEGSGIRFLYSSKHRTADVDGRYVGLAVVDALRKIEAQTTSAAAQPREKRVRVPEGSQPSVTR